MVQNGPKWSKIVQNGPKWSKKVQTGPKRSKTVQNGLKRTKTVQNSPKQSKNGQNWSITVQKGQIWSKTVKNGQAKRNKSLTVVRLHCQREALRFQEHVVLFLKLILSFPPFFLGKVVNLAGTTVGLKKHVSF